MRSCGAPESQKVEGERANSPNPSLQNFGVNISAADPELTLSDWVCSELCLHPSLPHSHMENQMGKLALGCRGLFGQPPTFVGHIQWVSRKFNCVCTTCWDGCESCFCGKKLSLCGHIVSWHPWWQLLGVKRGVLCSQLQGRGGALLELPTTWTLALQLKEDCLSWPRIPQLLIMSCSFPFSSCWQSGAFLQCLGALHAALKD